MGLPFRGCGFGGLVSSPGKRNAGAGRELGARAWGSSARVACLGRRGGGCVCGGVGGKRCGSPCAAQPRPSVGDRRESRRLGWPRVYCRLAGSARRERGDGWLLLGRRRGSKPRETGGKPGGGWPLQGVPRRVERGCGRRCPAQLLRVSAAGMDVSCASGNAQGARLPPVAS